MHLTRDFFMLVQRAACQVPLNEYQHFNKFLTKHGLVVLSPIGGCHPHCSGSFRGANLKYSEVARGGHASLAEGTLVTADFLLFSLYNYLTVGDLLSRPYCTERDGCLTRATR